MLSGAVAKLPEPRCVPNHVAPIEGDLLAALRVAGVVHRKLAIGRGRAGVGAVVCPLALEENRRVCDLVSLPCVALQVE